MREGKTSADVAQSRTPGPDLHGGLPLVMNLSINGTRVNATVVEIGTGTAIKRSDFNISNRLFSLLGSKKRSCESLLQNGRNRSVLQLVREMGELVYESIIAHLGVEHLFREGGYRVNIHCEGQAKALPVEIAHYEHFMFERNLLSLRGRNDPPADNVSVGRVLILADPSARYHWAVREGLLLHDFFRSIGISVSLVSRPLQKERLFDLFSMYDIVHFTGHAAADQYRTGWDIGTGIFRCSDIIMRKKLPALVFSSSCGNTLPMGFDFLRMGARNHVGSRWQIPDVNVCSFVLAFYERLFRLGDVGLAFHQSLNGRYRHGDVMPFFFVLQGELGNRYEKSDT